MDMKNITDRHGFIINHINTHGRATINELTELTDVSGVTIRKDLKVLEEKGLLYITRGGASINNPYSSDRPIQEKATINADQKNNIARAAVKLIGSNDSIIIGSGTTAYCITQHLHPSTPLTVITPAIKVSLELCDRPNIEVLQLGGVIRKNSSSVAGFYAEYILESLSSALIFIGVDGIDLNFGFSISNLTEANINQKMINTSQVVVIVADSTKFGKRGIGKICNIDDVDYVITDNKVPKEYVSSLEEAGIQVIIA